MTDQTGSPDEKFANPRLAAVYDDLDPDRSDLEHYAAIIDEFGARTVLDIGCGTGVFALMLADRGIEVTGVDPAAASLNVARAKTGAERVRWIDGDAVSMAPNPGGGVDIAVMTGNVAQVFVTDDAWNANLVAAHDSLRPDGLLVFETRVPERRAWTEWTRDQSYKETTIAGIGDVESWVDVTSVDLPLVTFDAFVVFPDGDRLMSTSTLRFRDREEVETSLAATGFEVVDVREAPDRPGKEFVFIAKRLSGRPG